MTDDPMFPHCEAAAPPGWLVFDCESIPDGKLLNIVKYPTETLTPEAAVARAQTEALDRTGSDFLPVTFQLPIAITMLRVGVDFSLQGIACLDAPHYRPREIVGQFWAGLEHHRKIGAGVKIVTFNGRGFDLPLLEMAAFRYGIAAPAILGERTDDWHLDLMDWLTNHGEIRLSGGLNLLAKLLGKPGKMEVTGNKVYRMWLDAKIDAINDYCLCDTLDTYFVFLRTRVMAGALALADEQALIRRTRDWLPGQTAAYPALAEYVTHWGDWQPWP
jgi:predicted PolB exonuclease-like 3'-5' exonuclease